MKIEITIICDDEKDIMTHLSVIRQQIRQTIKDDPSAGEWKIEDSNCYGEHTVLISDAGRYMED